MNYLFLAKTIREPKYYETKVKSAVNTKSCVVADTQEEIDKINAAAERLGLTLPYPCITTDEFVKQRNEERMNKTS